MKIRSLLLGSVAAAGLSTGAYAADLGVLTSLDVCDALGISGLTISSDTNCLKIDGSVSYTFDWGDYEDAAGDGVIVVTTADGDFTIAQPGGGQDWNSDVDAWIRFTATADSDFGPAKAVIKIKERKRIATDGAGPVINGDSTGDYDIDGDGIADTVGPVFDEAYVAVGDTTVIMAGKKGTIMNLGDDVPLNFLGLFNSENVDVGVLWTDDDFLDNGGHVIQITSDLGNGVSVSAALENLDDTAAAGAPAGTAVGVIQYSGEGLSAHATIAAGGLLDGVVERWGIHAGFSGTFDIVSFVAAFAADDTGYWNALASAAATFDIFKIALSGELANEGANIDYGVGGSITATVTDGVTLNLGGRYYNNQDGDDGWQVAAQLAALVTETVTLTGEVGVYGATAGGDIFYGAAQVAWAPGGGFTSSLKGEAYSNGAYKATFKAAKTFE